MISEFKLAIRRLRTDNPYTRKFWRSVSDSVRKRDRLLQESEDRLRTTPERMQARFQAPGQRGEG